jgi:hypothetical protein
VDTARSSGTKLLEIAGEGRKGQKLIPATSVKEIERRKRKRLLSFGYGMSWSKRKKRWSWERKGRSRRVLVAGAALRLLGNPGRGMQLAVNRIGVVMDAKAAKNQLRRAIKTPRLFWLGAYITLRTRSAWVASLTALAEGAGPAAAGVAAADQDLLVPSPSPSLLVPGPSASRP